MGLIHVKNLLYYQMINEHNIVMYLIIYIKAYFDYFSLKKRYEKSNKTIKLTFVARIVNFSNRKKYARLINLISFIDNLAKKIQKNLAVVILQL